MDFQALQNEVGAQLRFDVAVSANLSLVKTWINRSQQDIAGKHDWSWLQVREIVQTAADKNQDSPASSSVAITAGGTAVTGTSTDFATTDVGRYIQFPDTNKDWYRISARASTTACTIEAPFTGSADITGAKYTIRSLYYSLSASVDRIVSVKQARSPRRLGSMSPITLDRLAPFYTDTSSEPYLYACWGLDAANSGKWVVQFYPWPTAAMNMEVAYYAVATDLSANTDTGRMPQKLRDTLLVEGALRYGMKYLNDSRYNSQETIFKNMLDEAIANDGQNRGEFHILEAVDQGSPSDGTIIRMPANYPAPGDW